MGKPAYLKDESNLLRDAVMTPLSEDSTWPIGNVVLLPLSLPYRTVEGQVTGQYVDITLATSLSVDCCALVGHNLTSLALVKLYGDNDPSPAAGSAVEETISPRPRCAWHAFTAAAHRYWRVAIDDPGQSDGFLQIGYLLLGLKTQLTESFVAGWQALHAVRNRVTVTEFGSTVRGLTLLDQQRYVMSFDSLTFAMRDELRAFLRSLEGDRDPFLWIPDPDANEYEEAFFGRFRTDLSLTQRIGYAALSGVEFEEEALGRRLIDVLPSYADGDTVPSTSVAGVILAHDRSTTARKKDKTLTLVTVAADAARSEHFLTLGLRGTLLEGAGQNDLTYSEDLSNGAWTKNFATITQNAVASPDALVTADKVVETTDTGVHSVGRDVAGTTADTFQAVSGFAKSAERTAVQIACLTKANTWLTADVNLTTGAVTNASGGFTVVTEPYVSGWWRVLCRFDCGSGATPTRIEVRLMKSGSNSYAGTLTEGAYVWGLQWEIDDPWPTSYMATVASVATRSVDALTLSWTHAAQTMTAYARFLEIGGRYTDSASKAAMIDIGDDSVTSRFEVMAENDNYVERHATSGGAVTSTRVAGSIGTALGWNTVEVLAQLEQTGKVKVSVSVNGAAPGVGALSAALAIETPWGLPGPLRIGSFSGTKTGPLLVQRVLLRRGSTDDFGIFRVGKFASEAGIGVPWGKKPYGTFPWR